MPLTVGSILQFKFFQEFRGQEVLNIQHYEVLTHSIPVTTPVGFAQPIFNSWVTELQPLLSAGLTFQRGELYVVNALDFDTYVPTAPPAGDLVGDTLPPFNAVSIQQVRGSRATRHGWKRFAGAMEAQQDDGVLLPGVLTAWQTAADNLFNGLLNFTDPISPTRTIGIRAIIWGGNSPDFPLGRFSDIVGTVVKPEVTSQVTRKIGRGS